MRGCTKGALVLALLALSPGAPALPSDPILEEVLIEEDITFDSSSGVKGLVDDARRLLETRQWEAAARRATEAAAHAQELESDEGHELLIESLEIEARAMLALGDEHEARQRLAALVKADPTRSPSTRARDRFSRMLREVRQTLIASLSVQTEPEGAAVFLDGELLGSTPVDEVPVLAGRRTLIVERMGFTPSVEEILLAAGEHSAQSLELRREGATLLLMTPAEGVRVLLDGVARGHTARPSRSQARRLAMRSDWPIDAHDPPPLLLLSPVEPGPHVLGFEADCYRPRQIGYEIEESRDLVEIVSLERLEGSLRVGLAASGGDEAEAALVSVDGLQRGAAPLVVDGLCPGPHTIRLTTAGGLDLRRTVRVEEGGLVKVLLRPLPTLAWLGVAPGVTAGDRETAVPRLLERLEHFNSIMGSRSARELAALESEDMAAAERALLTTGAHLLAWAGSEPDGQAVLRLLAASSRRRESVPLAGVQGLLRRLDQVPARTTASLGILAVPDPRGGLLVAALRTGGPGFEAGLRPGERLLEAAGRPLGSEPLSWLETSLPTDRAVGLSVDRAGERREVELEPETTRLNWSAARSGGFANALLARLDADLAFGGTPDLAGDQLRRATLQLELGDAEAALLAAMAARLEESWGVGLGTASLLRGLAALETDRRDEALEALNQALALPECRSHGPGGPPLLPIIRSLHRRASSPR